MNIGQTEWNGIESDGMCIHTFALFRAVETIRVTRAAIIAL